MAQDYMQAAAKAVDKTLKNNNLEAGFCVLVFGFDRPGIANYVSNADRESMIKALRETADRLEKNQDNQSRS